MFFLTFSVGFSVYRYCDPYLKVSLEEISKNAKDYEGKQVELITYLRTNNLDTFDDSLALGEQYERPEVWAILNVKTNSINLDSLRSQLNENHHYYDYKRVKVLVRGTLIYNCNKGVTCCGGESVTIIADKVEQLGNIEDYSVAEKYRSSRIKEIFKD